MQHRPRPPVTLPRQTGSRPALPMVQLPIYRVKQRHLEAYLAKVYRMEGFDFLLAAGATPGMCPEYRVSPALPPAWSAQQEADRIRRGHPSRNVGLILNVLCLDGYIPAGAYTIDTHPEPPPGQVYRALLLKTGAPGHPDCVAFRREHRHERAFTQLAAQMDKAVLEAQREKK
ncbi:MAG: hypothetical protein ABSE84_00555 [Isosphaeraceae bacterium]